MSGREIQEDLACPFFVRNPKVATPMSPQPQHMDADGRVSEWLSQSTTHARSQSTAHARALVLSEEGNSPSLRWREMMQLFQKKNQTTFGTQRVVFLLSANLHEHAMHFVHATATNCSIPPCSHPASFPLTKCDAECSLRAFTAWPSAHWSKRQDFGRIRGKYHAPPLAARCPALAKASTGRRQRQRSYSQL